MDRERIEADVRDARAFWTCAFWTCMGTWHTARGAAPRVVTAPMLADHCEQLLTALAKAEAEVERLVEDAEEREGAAE